MKPKNLLILFITLLVVGGIAFLAKSLKRNQLAGSLLAGRKVLGEFPAGDIARLVFHTPHGVLTFAKVSEGSWCSPNRYNYPVRFDKVRDFVRDLVDLEVGQVVRADDKDRTELQLLAPSDGNNQPGQVGALIDIQDAEGKQIAQLLLGADLG